MKEAPFCTLLFYQVLVKPHEDTSRLGSGACTYGIDGTVVVAVNQLVAIGPFHGYLGPISYAAAVRELGKVALST